MDLNVLQNQFDSMINNDIIHDNEYLELYKKFLIDKSLEKNIKFKTQTHHIIPKIYYQLNDLAIDDTSQNKVILYFKDHIYAHYLLVFIIKDEELKYRLQHALTSMCNTAHKKDSSIDFSHLEYLQEIYEECLQTKSLKYKGSKKLPVSEASRLRLKQCRQKYLDTHPNRAWITDGKINHLIYDFDEAWKNRYPGFRQGRTLSEEEINRRKNKSKLLTDEQKKHLNRLHAANKGNQYHSKKVYCIDLDLYFDSVNKAIQQLGISGDIAACCRGEQYTAGKHYWAFADDLDRIEFIKDKLNRGIKKTNFNYHKNNIRYKKKNISDE